MQQTLLVLLAIVLPILFVDYPILFETMGDVRGTYDVLITSIPLSRQEVFQLLPPSVRQEDEEKTFYDIPDEVYDALIPIESKGKKDHLIILQLGYQISTGPGPDWLPKFSFSECKLEIPFIKHPKIESNTPMGYKQTILFSNQLIKLGGTLSGLSSKIANFDPPLSPSNYHANAKEIVYTVKEYLEAKAIAQESNEFSQNHPSWTFYQNYVQDWWFGMGTGEKLQKFKFDFENSIIPPKPYQVEIEINLNAFKPKEFNSQLELRTIKFTGVGWRSRAKHQIISSTQNQTVK